MKLPYAHLRYTLGWWRCLWRGHQPYLARVISLDTAETPAAALQLHCRRCGMGWVITSLAPEFFTWLPLVCWLLPPAAIAALNQRLHTYIQAHAAALLQPAPDTPGQVCALYPVGNGQLRFKVRRVGDGQESEWQYTDQPDLYLVATQVRALLPAVVQFFNQDFNTIQAQPRWERLNPPCKPCAARSIVR